ncbi:hypothetical protein [Primorskyibacter sp. S187A]|uniref:hypothetical protein n=1 Tax=Primorskyibacter sp. S187A TaxID=3415130 RepID=UPI003C7E9458
MRKVLIASLILATAAGCARVRDSNINPLNWFGRSSSAPVTTSENTNPLIPARRASVFQSEEDRVYRGTLVGNVTDLRIEQVQGGAVIKATGVATSLGAFDVRLVRDEADSDGSTLTFEMRALQPSAGRGRGTEQSRTVTVATNLSTQDLLGVRTIRVVSASNVRSSRR